MTNEDPLQNIHNLSNLRASHILWLSGQVIPCLLFRLAILTSGQILLSRVFLQGLYSQGVDYG